MHKSPSLPTNFSQQAPGNAWPPSTNHLVPGPTHPASSTSSTSAGNRHQRAASPMRSHPQPIGQLSLYSEA